MQSYIQFLTLTASLFGQLELTPYQKMLKARAKKEYKQMTYAERRSLGLLKKFPITN